jgi:hypothetical protein
MLPCLTCLHDLPAKQRLGCPPCLSFACGLIKMLEGHPVMHHGACMVRLTRLPPSKHVLMLSTPLISKIKIKSEILMSSNINLEEFLKH